MSSKISLPSTTEAEVILTNFSQHLNGRVDDSTKRNTFASEEIEEKWRNLCLSALSYGTGYNNWSRKKDDSTKDELRSRAMQTLEFFTTLLNKEGDKHIWNGDMKTFLVPSPQSVLIDSFWLVSSVIRTPQKSAINKECSLESLRIIICGLASKLPLSFSKRLQITLDPTLLTNFQLIQQEGVSFATKIKRFVTNVLYRQKKFNLLVEESEGYAKLLAFLYSSQQLIVQAKKGSVSVYIRELMGTFDLDPNRVLDLILHVMEIYLDGIQKGKNNLQVLSILKKFLKEFKRESLPQILGFKLSSMQNEKSTRNTTIFLTCAYLICNDLVDLRDLAPHLQPSIDEMMEFYKKKRSAEIKRIKKIGVISLNANNDRSEEDNNQNSNTSEMQVLNDSPPQNQIIYILEALLSFEAWDKTYSSSHLFWPAESKAENPAIQVLSRACIISRKVTNAICRMIHGAIEPVYEAEIRDKSLFFQEMKICHKNCQTKENMDETNILSQCISDSIKIKRIQSIDDLVSTLYTPLMTISESGGIQKDPILYCKLCRLFKELLSRKKLQFDEFDHRLMSILKTFLVPSISLFFSNPSVSSELWGCINNLPYTTRFVLYDAWRGPHLEKGALRMASNTTSAKPLTHIESEILTGLECRYTLKRLSKDNVKDLGRLLAKTSHNNPIVVFSAVLNQIEAYDNMIALMVDSFKFVTKLSLDVLGYCLLLSLGGGGESVGGRMKTKLDGMGTTQWLNSLSQFTGALYKRFPEIEIRAVIAHLINELRHGRISELPVLRCLLTTAGGCDSADCDNTASLSSAQLEGRSGSPLLKRETSSFGVIEKYNKKSSKKLREVLQNNELGLPLLMLLAQVKERIMYESNDGEKQYLKVMGKSYDSCHSLFGILLEFLTDSTDEENIPHSSNTIAKYAKMLPTLEKLTKDYGLNSVTVWMFCRPLLRAAILSGQNTIKDEKMEEEGEEKEEEEAKKEKNDVSIPSYLAPYIPSSKELLSAYEYLVPTSNWDYLTTDLYECFWSLSLYDISCPESRYMTEIHRLKKESGRLMTQQNIAADRELGFSASDKLELDRVKKTADALTTDLQTQKNHHDYILFKLGNKKSVFFLKSDMSTDAPENSTLQFLSLCTFPRCTVSPEDAIYCARFIQILHELETPDFHTLLYLDKLIMVIAGALFCVTEAEAGNIGLLLCETWTILSQWRYMESKYNVEVFSKPGSILSGKNTTFSAYIVLYSKWHAAIGNSLLGCLQSKEYIHVRAAITILSCVVNVFPTRPRLGEKLFQQLVPLQEDNARPDIKTMANFYVGQLEKARKDGVWKEQDAAKANKIIEEEKAKAEKKIKKAERIFDAMKKDNEQIDKEHHNKRGGRFGDRPYPRRENQPLVPTAAVFTPANGPSRDLNWNGTARDLRGSHRTDPHPPRSQYRDRHRDRYEHENRRERGLSAGGVGGSGGGDGNTGSSSTIIKISHGHGHGHGHNENHRERRLQQPTRPYSDGVIRGRSPPRDGVGGGRGPTDGMKRDRSEIRDHDSSRMVDHKRPRPSAPPLGLSGGGNGRGPGEHVSSRIDRRGPRR